MKKLNVGVIGLGVGRQHALSYRQNQSVDKIYLCDFDVDKCKKVSDEVGAEFYYSNWVNLLSLNLDAISICSYDQYHTEQILAFAKNGVSIMVEKPMCINEIELNKIEKSPFVKEIIIQCNFIMREYPRFQKIKSLVKKNIFGDIFYVEAGYLHLIEEKITSGWRGEVDGYTTLLGGGIHLLDQIIQIFDDEIIQMVGMSNKIATRNTKFLQSDTFVNLFKLRSGIIVKLISSYSTRRPKLHSFNIYGTKGSLEHRDNSIEVFSNDNLKDIKRYSLPYPGVNKGGKIDQFIDDVKHLKKTKEIKTEIEYLIKLHRYCFDAIRSIS